MCWCKDWKVKEFIEEIESKEKQLEDEFELKTIILASKRNNDQDERLRIIETKL